jgi:hypothetical protein
MTNVSYLMAFVIKCGQKCTVSRAVGAIIAGGRRIMPLRLLTVDDHRDGTKCRAQAEDHRKRYDEIEENILLVRFAGLAVVFGAAVLAFDV